jgi:hypothetical protein
MNFLPPNRRGPSAANTRLRAEAAKVSLLAASSCPRIIRALVRTGHGRGETARDETRHLIAEARRRVRDLSARIDILAALAGLAEEEVAFQQDEPEDASA